MLMILYTIIAWVITPFIYEFVNQHRTIDNKVTHYIKGWPSWVINVIICVVVAFVITALPKGWAFTVANVFLLTCVIYFGNQFFFTSVIKPLRAKLGK